ncbi:MAG: phenylalanine--tRNA ligase subunit beta, partial [Oscillospiraceae bacterium]
GSKVEGYEVEGSDISGVVVGKIVDIKPHEDSDHLLVCKVDIGAAQPVQIVTGASNVFIGAVVPVATDGAELPGGVKIKTGKLRGVESCGMLCSLPELGLSQHDFPYAIEDGIFIMQEECKLGQDIQSAIGFNDTCVEFEITSNRPDCLSVRGLAREAHATFGVPCVLPEPVVKGSGDAIENYLSVEVKNAELCKRYAARIVKNVKIEPSPRWIRERLRASGVRPINNIVDITNYVMLEYGQPMHAFDHKYVNGKKIVVRNAVDGEVITTLDGTVRKLSSEMLVIADSLAPSAVAGVMGGEFSGIQDDTSVIVFESANFLGSSVRTTAKKLGMRTESSGRFEKDLDPQGCIPALQRACELVELLGAGEVVDGMIDINNTSEEHIKIKFEPEWTNKFLGTDISEQDMKAMLKTVGFEVNDGIIIVPYFRTDVFNKADIAEEVARIYGYNSIPTTALRGSAQAKLTPMQKFEKLISTTLLAQGLYEIMTYPFISPKYYDKICLAKNSVLRKSVEITNPLGEDTSVMRTTSLPSLLEVLARNYNNRNPWAGMYELATRYTPVDGQELPNEEPEVAFGMYGNDCDFYDLKGIAEVLLEVIGIKDYDVTAESNNPTFHPGRCAVISKDGKTIGVFGEVHPTVLGNYGIECRAYAASFDINTLFALKGGEKLYKATPKFPATTRDIALLCDDEVPVLRISKAIKKATGDIFEKVELFDVYRGAQIEAGKKSVAFNITLRAADRTLTDTEADKAMERILAAAAELGAKIRG